IVEHGTHDGLLQKDGSLYRDMWYEQEMSDPIFDEEYDEKPDSTDKK
ncbi:6501_t:CDS:1, partial [Racocetra persica]